MPTLRLHERIFLPLFAVGWTYLCFELGRFSDSGSQGTVADGLAAAVLMGSPVWCIVVWADSPSAAAGWLRIAVLLVLLPIAFLATLFAWGSITTSLFSAATLFTTGAALSLWYFFYIVYQLHLARSLKERATAQSENARVPERS